MSIERKYLPFLELKLFDDDEVGGFEGHVSTVGDLDDVGDIIVAGAYDKHLQKLVSDGFHVDSHNWTYGAAIGYPIDARVDGKGLFVKSRFHSTPDAQLVRQKMKERIDAGKTVFYSIGYFVKKSERIQPTEYAERLAEFVPAEKLQAVLMKAAGFPYGIRILKEIEIAESSPVLRPANTDSRATGVKSADGGEGSDDGENNDAGSHDGLRFKDRHARAHDAMSELIKDWKQIVDGELKEGRAISTARIKRIETLRDALRGTAKSIAEGADELEALLAEAAPPPKEKGEETDDESAKAAVEAEQKIAQNLHAQFLAIESLHLNVGAL